MLLFLLDRKSQRELAVSVNNWNNFYGLPVSNLLKSKKYVMLLSSNHRGIPLWWIVYAWHMGSPEIYDHISWVDSSKNQKIVNKRKMNTQEFLEEEKFDSNLKNTKLSIEERKQVFNRFYMKKDYVCLERINRRIVNILDGLQLYIGVFNSMEQKEIVQFIYDLQNRGRNNELGEHTYSEPKKWMRGKGRVTIQFGCCYHYAEKNGIPPGILCNGIVDPISNLFKIMINRLITSHVLPISCEPGDCIPPHIDSHDFIRPFCTVSFLSKCNIIFGHKIKIVGPDEFIGSASIPLPVGSVLVLDGNGANLAKHCIPAVSYKMISVTFRKIDKAKQPHNFKFDSDFQNIKSSDFSDASESYHTKKGDPKPMRGDEEAGENDAVEDGGVGVDNVFVRMPLRKEMEKIQGAERIGVGAEDFERLMRLKRKGEAGEIGAMAPLRVCENSVDGQRRISVDERRERAGKEEENGGSLEL
ncbi:hypothetical protein IEQ34_021059 [Dendrobium chrysotoxum]|uniref:Fe2OG dioxygenase domain-containing protein n=1 Tax=Dendrobium chrysotoxum TaxID=161865 RepID=A0AAV7G3S6_DENCH|nr:hypothetical protein IEQ34_021059 [Dendrobium chrysotoxum]